MHTKGPWTIREDKGHAFTDGQIDYGGFRIDAPGIEQLAYVWRSNIRFGSNEPFGADEAEANARLIAAAPDLLDALKNLLAFVEGEMGSSAEDDCNVLAAHDAITKATCR